MLTRNHFGCASRFYRQAIHPRVLFGPEELEELRSWVRKGNGKRILDAIHNELRPLIAEALKESVEKLLSPGSKRKAEVASRLLSRLFEFALIGELRGDASALEVSLRVFEFIPEIADSSKRREHRGVPLSAFLAYDLLHRELGEKTRRELCEWTLRDVIERSYERVQKDIYFCAGMNIPLAWCRNTIYPALAIQGDSGVPDLEPVIQDCARFMRAFCRTGIGPDGYPEEDIGYGTSCVCAVTEIGEMLFRSGHFNMFKHPRWRKFGRALLYFVQPWGRRLSITGDFGDDPAISYMALARLAHETGDRTLLWLTSTLENSRIPTVRLANGLRVFAHYSSLLYLDVFEERGMSPEEADVPTAFVDRGRGIVSVRSSWRKDATYAHFDASQRHASVMGHWHGSAGHFSLSALGEYFSIDTGRYNVDHDQHSVMLVDGVSPHSTEGEWRGTDYMGRLIGFRSCELSDIALIDSSQMSDCFWAFRLLGLVKGKGITPYLWTVDDVNKDNDYHEFFWTMQVHPRNEIRIRGKEATIVGYRHGNMLDLAFVYPPEGQYPKPHTLSLEQGTITTSSYKYIKDIKGESRRRDPLSWSVLIRKRLIARLAGYNGKLMSVMVPRRKGRKPIVFERLETTLNSLAMKIRFPRVTDTLIYSYEHGFLEAEDIEGEGEFALVRRRRNDNHPIASLLLNGEKLKVGGRTLRPAKLEIVR